MSNESTPHEHVNRLLNRLERVRKVGPNQWVASSPTRPDVRPSLSIKLADDGRILIFDHGGDKTENILSTIGLKMSDLYPPNKNGGRGKTSDPVIVTYQYTDKDGNVLFEVCRTAAKQFYQRRPDGKGGYVNGRGGIAPVLYRLPDLSAVPKGTFIFVVEGEKDADRLAREGLVATTNPQGAGKWGHVDATPLHGRDVVILPDNDRQGRRHAEKVAKSLYGKAASVRIVKLDGLPEQGDVSDWLDAGHDVEDLVERAAKTPLWTPSVGVSDTDTGIRIPYKQFPTHLLPQPCRRFVELCSRAIGCDPAFVALPMLSALAGIIGNTMVIQLKRGWTEPSVVWTAIIGESGSHKSPAFRVVQRPLMQLQTDALKQHAEEMEEYDRQMLDYEKALIAWKKTKAKDEPPEKPEKPRAVRFLVSDTTVEALAPILADNPNGVVLLRDELGGWLASFDRYAGRKGASGDAAQWLIMHGADTLIVDRKTGPQKTIVVPHAAVSISGGIQPGTLERAIGTEHRQDGLCPRILFAMPPRKQRKWTEADIPPSVNAEFESLIKKLMEQRNAVPDDGPDPTYVKLSPEAKSLWITYFNKHAAEQVELDGELASAWSKLEGYAARLALLVHCVRSANGETENEGVLDEQSMAAGIELSQWFSNETERVYALFDESDEERQQRQLIDLIERHGGSITPNDLRRRSRRLRTSEDAENALDELVEAGVGTWDDTQPGKAGGRPKRVFNLVSPVSVTETPAEDSASGGLGYGYKGDATEGDMEEVVI